MSAKGKKGDYVITILWSENKELQSNQVFRGKDIQKLNHKMARLNAEINKLEDYGYDKTKFRITCTGDPEFRYIGRYDLGDYNEYTTLEEQIRGTLEWHLDGDKIKEWFKVIDDIFGKNRKISLKEGMTTKEEIKEIVKEFFDEIGNCTTERSLDQFKDGMFWNDLEEFMSDKDIIITPSEMTKRYLPEVLQAVAEYDSTITRGAVKKIVTQLWDANNVYIDFESIETSFSYAEEYGLITKERKGKTR